jgi:hypothetical protein
MTGSPLRRLQELAAGHREQAQSCSLAEKEAKPADCLSECNRHAGAHYFGARAEKPAPMSNSRRLAAATALLGCLLMGCSAGSSSDSSPAPQPVSPARPPSVQVDGVTLAALGYLNGPIEQFSLPRTAVITAKVDQPNNVAVVLSSPSPAEVASYLRRALPAAGFTITAEDTAAKTMTFTGNGWTGNFTGNSRASAVLLRPQ